MTDETEILVKACQKKKRQAQEKLYKQFSPVLYAICRRYCKDDSDAQDALQESFIIIFNKIHQFKFQGSFEGWAKRITVNNCLLKLKNQTYFLNIEEQSQHHVEEQQEIEVFQEETDMDKIMHHIQEMPERYRMVFNLYFFEELSHKEIAEKLEIQVGTSKSNLSRAKDWMRGQLKKNDKLTQVI